jgi:hypothetical protein
VNIVGRHWYTDYDPIVGDNDGHECYEDEPEDDYCEGDDDGYQSAHWIRDLSRNRGTVALPGQPSQDTRV